MSTAKKEWLFHTPSACGGVLDFWLKGIGGILLRRDNIPIIDNDSDSPITPATMPPQTPPTPQSVYQLKITLKDARPPIWRRVQVASDITLGKLHRIIQTSMGWTNSHLHAFLIQGVEYGQPMPEYDIDVKNEQRVKLSQVVMGEKCKFLYTYDMGDGWEHEILVEKVLPADAKMRHAVCLTGKRSCPPEDCGGVWGYVEFLAAIRQPDHPEHESMLEWIGGAFDPEYFDLEEVNHLLKQIR